MSATNRGGDYRPGAAYYTPLSVATHLVSLLPMLDQRQVVLEPSVGRGAFIEALRAEELRRDVYHRVLALDADPTAPGLAMVQRDGGWAGVGDFLRVLPPERPTLILGNPPYADTQPVVLCPRCEAKSAEAMATCKKCGGTGAYTPPPKPAAEAHVRRALQVVQPGGHVAFLLRLGMLEGAERLDLWREHPALHIWVLATRPPFTGEGADQTSYGYFLWRKGYRGTTTIETTDWRGSIPDSPNPRLLAHPEIA